MGNQVAALFRGEIDGKTLASKAQISWVIRWKSYWFNGHQLEHSLFWDKPISEDEGSAHFSLMGLKLNQ